MGANTLETETVPARDGIEKCKDNYQRLVNGILWVDTSDPLEGTFGLAHALDHWIFKCKAARIWKVDRCTQQAESDAGNKSCSKAITSITVSTWAIFINVYQWIWLGLPFVLLNRSAQLTKLREAFIDSWSPGFHRQSSRPKVTGSSSIATFWDSAVGCAVLDISFDYVLA